MGFPEPLPEPSPDLLFRSEERACYSRGTPEVSLSQTQTTHELLPSCHDTSKKQPPEYEHLKIPVTKLNHTPLP